MVQYHRRPPLPKSLLFLFIPFPGPWNGSDGLEDSKDTIHENGPFDDGNVGHAMALQEQWQNDSQVTSWGL